MKTGRKKVFRAILGLIFISLCIAIGCNIWLVLTTKKQLFSDIQRIPPNKVGLVLGTSKFFSNGNHNLFFRYRIEAAVALFESKKIRHIIVSGDNSKIAYNETQDMKNALVAAGVPDSCITLDFAGFRTFDSVIRCNKVFGQTNFTIISQEFHNQRAVFIGNSLGLEVVGFNAKAVEDAHSFKTLIREFFAKTRAVFDIYIFHAEPKFLGEKVKAY